MNKKHAKLMISTMLAAGIAGLPSLALAYTEDAPSQAARFSPIQQRSEAVRPSAEFNKAPTPAAPAQEPQPQASELRQRPVARLTAPTPGRTIIPSVASAPTASSATYYPPASVTTVGGGTETVESGSGLTSLGQLIVLNGLFGGVGGVGGGYGYSGGNLSPLGQLIVLDRLFGGAGAMTTHSNGGLTPLGQLIALNNLFGGHMSNPAGAYIIPSGQGVASTGTMGIATPSTGAGQGASGAMYIVPMGPGSNVSPLAQLIILDRMFR